MLSRERMSRIAQCCGVRVREARLSVRTEHRRSNFPALAPEQMIC
jgi:hypothetical protein